jgi:hypothetical protein
LNKVANPLYKLLPSEKLTLRGKNRATDLGPMASDFFFQFKKIRISVSPSGMGIQGASLVEARVP